MDAPRASRHSGDRSVGTVDSKSLVIGREIKLKGEITSCEQVIVEGQIEISLTDARRIQIGPTGVFLGKADVAEADISGRFDGELTVRDRLTVRDTGRVGGKIRYGCMIVEAGGEIAGEVRAIVPDSQPDERLGALPRPVSAPSAEVSRDISEELEHELEASRD